MAEYDNLTAARVQDRLGTVNAAEFRKVRDHERRHQPQDGAGRRRVEARLS
jgi:hypothetical protein